MGTQMTHSAAPRWAHAQKADAESLRVQKQSLEALHRYSTRPQAILSNKPVMDEGPCQSGMGARRNERKWVNGNVPVLRRDDVVPVGLKEVDTHEGPLFIEVGAPLSGAPDISKNIPKLVEQFNTRRLPLHRT